MRQISRYYEPTFTGLTYVLAIIISFLSVYINKIIAGIMYIYMFFSNR